MFNYIHKLTICGVEVYKHSNSGRWYFKNKKGNMQRLPLF
ncbi:hypothetical protein HNR44_001432 [Geomicrobium halophilum]|uniref:Uncharacterized protein n=1 Tax=Geomicrobium halophilum TaxID=549000 RepID=A0A841PY28_9BACL|nr:hypothetical protein [Geomicrobium halophilum]